MKKSELYREAALAVMRDEMLVDSVRLDIIVELMEKASLEKFCEEQAAKKALEEKEEAV